MCTFSFPPLMERTLTMDYHHFTYRPESNIDFYSQLRGEVRSDLTFLSPKGTIRTQTRFLMYLR